MMLISLNFLFVVLITSFLTGADTTMASVTDSSPCTHQPYKVHLFSRRPLIIYIEDFVSQDEAKELISLASKFYQTSEVVLNDNSGKLSEALPSHRLSQSMYLYPENSTPLTDCIRDRAAHFQGIPSDRLEPLQVVRYATDGFFKHHYDWLSQSQEDGAYSPDVKCNGDSYCEKGMGDRESTFFVYLQADCEGGETEFPEVEMGKDLDSKMWCEFVACEDKDRGVKFRPKAGNAVFWENMEDGKGIGEVLHAGLPVTTGGKIGLNIWSRQRSEVGGGNDVVKFETYGAGEDMKVREKADEGHREL